MGDYSTTHLKFKECDDDCGSNLSQDKSTKGSAASSPGEGSGANAETAFFAFNEKTEEVYQKKEITEEIKEDTRVVKQ